MKKLVIAMFVVVALMPVYLTVAQDEDEEVIDDRDAQVDEIYDSLEQEVSFVNGLVYFYLPEDYTANIQENQAVIFANEETAAYYTEMVAAITLSLEDAEAGEEARAAVVVPDTANSISMTVTDPRTLGVESMEEFVMNQVITAQENVGQEFEFVGPIETEVSGYPALYIYYNLDASTALQTKMSSDLIASVFIGVFEIEGNYFISTQIAIGEEDLTPIGEAIFLSQWIDEEVLDLMKAEAGQ
jgi:hypothetical protein